MSTSSTILMIGVVPMCKMLPLLTEYIDEQHITHHSLLGQIRQEDMMAEYGASSGDELLLTLLNDHQLAHASHQKVEHSLQSIVKVLDSQGFDVILLMSAVSIIHLTARNSISLGPIHIIPPLVASVVEGHRVEVIVPVTELLKTQAQEWQVLQTPPVYTVTNLVEGSEQQLIDAGKHPLEQGADALILDHLGFHQRHRDLLQKPLGVPALLSSVLVVRLASELLVQFCITGGTSAPYTGP